MSSGDMLNEMKQREKKSKRNYRLNIPISSPLEDFRVISSVVDADLLPDTIRRVKLLKDSPEKPLSFFIKEGKSVRITAKGSDDVKGIFISKLVPGGLAEGCGLLSANDEILEVNGIEVTGKSVDQVVDILAANHHNLIITVKPGIHRTSLQNSKPLATLKSGSSS